jgi:hypothetical protein
LDFLSNDIRVMNKAVGVLNGQAPLVNKTGNAIPFSDREESNGPRWTPAELAQQRKLLEEELKKVR